MKLDAAVMNPARSLLRRRLILKKTEAPSRSRTRAGADREQGRELSTPRHPPAATYRASSGETRAAPTESARDVAPSEGAPIIILRPAKGATL